MKNAFLAVGMGAWVAFIGHGVSSLHQKYQQQHPVPAVVAASKYQTAQAALRQSQAQVRALQTWRATVCTQAKGKKLQGC